jgi:hypothetical protein
MKKTFKIGISILALAAVCSAHPGHDWQGYGLYWKHPGHAHLDAEVDMQIWRYAFVSVYSWTGSR